MVVRRAPSSVISDVDEPVPKHTESTQTAENSLWNVAFTQLPLSCSEHSWRRAVIWVGDREHPSSLLPLYQPCARHEL